ncbi:extensin-like [Panthera tigris]|uniref:extensin-like n=1 Tax=Panthera tigris TaxID=9694 RepID=UPI001C6F8990|nr:extensin-like [Panthera tigris]
MKSREVPPRNPCCQRQQREPIGQDTSQWPLQCTGFFRLVRCLPRETPVASTPSRLLGALERAIPKPTPVPHWLPWGPPPSNDGGAKHPWARSLRQDLVPREGDPAGTTGAEAECKTQAPGTLAEDPRSPSGPGLEPSPDLPSGSSAPPTWNPTRKAPAPLFGIRGPPRYHLSKPFVPTVLGSPAPQRIPIEIRTEEWRRRG